jgi:TonB family protein
MKRYGHYLMVGVFLMMSAAMLISDEAAQNSVTASVVPAQYQRWLNEEVPYIITPLEKDVFLKLKTDTQRDIFIDSFWKQRDTNPATAENEFKAEYYRRLEYANRTFGSAATPGWKTDLGKLYIVFGTVSAPFDLTMKLRVFEGLKEGMPSAQSITSSYLKYMLSANIPSDAVLEAEQDQIKKTFNLKDVKLVTESNMSWKKGEWQKAHHMFRLDGKLYEVAVESKDVLSHQFHIEVNDVTEKTRGSLLDTEVTIPKKNVAVFGFEDSHGKPYFISLREQAIDVGVDVGAGESNKPPMIIKKVDPIYPKEAKDAQKEGIVILKARTDVFGRVENVKVERPVDPALDQAAVDAVMQWVYEPAIVDGQPKSIEFTVAVRFTLDKEKGGAVGGTVGGVLGGVEGGVKGGVEAGVEGGVKGGVEGGVVGGVVGGVLGGGQKEDVEKKRQEFEKDAVPVKGEVRQPKLLKKIEPVYPEAALKKGIQGIVILEAKIDEQGKVIDVLVLRSVPGLDQAAIDAVKQWVYEPMIIKGKPQKAIFTTTVNFRLGEKDIEKFAEGAVKVKDAIEPPKIIKKVDPVYPEAARKLGVEGVVILQARTDIYGRVKDVMVLRSVPALNQAAIDAVKQWVYEPLVIEGKPREAVFTTTVQFSLDGHKKKSGEEAAAGATGQVEPKVLKKVDPVYPEAARKAGIEGIVLLEATTDAKGDVVKVKVLKSVPELDQAAIDALRQWKYEPYVIDGKPMGIVFTVTIRFMLK